MVTRKAIFIPALAVATLVAQGTANLEHFSISQAASTPPTLAAYVDVTGARDEPLPSLQGAALEADVEGKPVPVKTLKPFAETGEGVAYIFLVDVSKSVSAQKFASVQRAILTFTGNLKPADRAAVIAFGDQVRIVSAFTADHDALKKSVTALQANGKMTHLNEALLEASKLAHRLDADLPQRRAIIILSDGKDEGSGFTTDDVLDVFKQNRIPIYAIGASSLPKADAAKFLEVLHRYSVRSGGVYFDLSGGSVEQAYGLIRERVTRVWEAKLDCAACPADNQNHQLQLRISMNGQALADRTSVALGPVATPTPVKQEKTKAAPPLPWWKTLAWWIWACAGAGLLLLILGLTLLLRRKKAVAPLVEMPLPPPMPEPSFVAKDIPGLLSTNRLSGAAEAAAPAVDQRPGPIVEFLRRGDARGVQPYSATLVERLVVGRSQEAQVCIPDQEISKKHCQLELLNGLVLITDLGSTHGTAVNGVPITSRHKIESGDLVALGPVEFRVRIHS